MSKQSVAIAEIKMIDGVKKRKTICKDVTIDFSAADFHTVRYVDEYSTLGPTLELVPDNMDFLHELTDIFPLSKHGIKILQHIWHRDMVGVDIRINISGDKGGESFPAGSVLLSDGDYEYLRSVLLNAAPEFEWLTAESYLESHISGYVKACSDDCSDMFSKTSKRYLAKYFSEHVMDFKVRDHVAYDFKKVEHAAKRLVEDALRCACTSQK